jgi:uncharacterized protein (TIGR02594 family)
MAILGLIALLIVGIFAYILYDLNQAGVKSFKQFDAGRYWNTNQMRIVLLFVGGALFVGVLYLIKDKIDELVQHLMALAGGVAGPLVTKKVSGKSVTISKKPTLLGVMRSIYNTREVAGPESNPVIIRWAKDLGWDWYNDDSIHWCALCMSWVIWKSGREHTNSARAISYATWGLPATVEDIPSGNVVAVFKNHVGVAVAEDGNRILVAGGNQSDNTNETWFDKTKSKFVGYRKPAA